MMCRSAFYLSCMHVNVYIDWNFGNMTKCSAAYRCTESFRSIVGVVHRCRLSIYWTTYTFEYCCTHYIHLHYRSQTSVRSSFTPRGISLWAGHKCATDRITRLRTTCRPLVPIRTRCDVSLVTFSDDQPDGFSWHRTAYGFLAVWFCEWIFSRNVLIFSKHLIENSNVRMFASHKSVAISGPSECMNNLRMVLSGRLKRIEFQYDMREVSRSRPACVPSAFRRRFVGMPSCTCPPSPHSVAVWSRCCYTFNHNWMLRCFFPRIATYPVCLLRTTKNIIINQHDEPKHEPIVVHVVVAVDTPCVHFLPLSSQRATTANSDRISLCTGIVSANLSARFAHAFRIGMRWCATGGHDMLTGSRRVSHRCFFLCALSVDVCIASIIVRSVIAPAVVAAVFDRRKYGGEIWY